MLRGLPKEKTPTLWQPVVRSSVVGAFGRPPAR